MYCPGWTEGTNQQRYCTLPADSKFKMSQYCTAYASQKYLQKQCLWPACDIIKENEPLIENFNFFFLTPLSHNIKMLHFMLMQTPLQLDIWLQSHEGFVNAKTILKNLITVFANFSKRTSPTSDSFLLIMSHIVMTKYWCNRSFGQHLDTT